MPSGESQIWDRMARILDSRRMEDFLMKLSTIGLGSGLAVLILYGTVAIATTQEEWSLDKQKNGIDI